MRLAPLAFLLAAAGIAAHLSTKARRNDVDARATPRPMSSARRAGHGAGGADNDARDNDANDNDDDANDDDANGNDANGNDARDNDDEPMRAAAVPNPSTDSPNAAERLAAHGLAETPGDGRADDLFGSNASAGAEPRTPGLPDFMRGA